MTIRETGDTIRATLETLDSGTLVNVWRENGIRAEDLVPDTRGTIGRPDIDASLTMDAIRGGAFTPRGNPEEGGVVQGEVIGSGGMGVVREGTQLSLRRPVAVKQVHPDDSPNRELRLAAFLREAWVSASLEHPNIIPVHALCSDHGDPVLVMKRVEGVSWRAVLEDPALAHEHGLDHRDPLMFHVRVALRVCRAVHFAHTRGVVHLDLKPDNVMVGMHGEVYLLDWGLAASFHDDAEAFLPRTSDIQGVVGTPGYLSPEQAAGLSALLGPCTDIFLLGALLHRVVTGSVPYGGGTLMQALGQAFACEPQVYGEDVPAELAAIMTRAMQRSFEDRYASVEDLRLALEHFVEHRDVNQLLDESWRRFSLLEEDHASDLEAPRDASALRRIENECRFGFEEALVRWPENTRAQRGYGELARLTVKRALRAGDWRAAAAALERLPVPDAELRAQVNAVRARAAEIARERVILEDLGSNQDLLRYADVRSKVSAFVGFGWSAWFFAVGAMLREGVFELTHTHLLLNAILTFMVYAAVMWRVRDTLHSTQIDRRALWLLAVCFLGAGVLWRFAAFLGVSPLHTVALSSSVYVFFFVATATVIDRRLAWVAPVLTPLALVPYLDVEHVFEWQGVYVAVGAIALSLTWRRDARLARERGTKPALAA